MNPHRHRHRPPIERGYELGMYGVTTRKQMENISRSLGDIVKNPHET